ncbi:MAG: hypothetical protein JWO38_6855 [Gemmataceae bacterium]|nr:hypothetical protein [Gemmataceae bacterium]
MPGTGSPVQHPSYTGRTPRRGGRTAERAYTRNRTGRSQRPAPSARTPRAAPPPVGLARRPCSTPCIPGRDEPASTPGTGRSYKASRSPDHSRTAAWAPQLVMVTVHAPPWTLQMKHESIAYTNWNGEADDEIKTGVGGDPTHEDVTKRSVHTPLLQLKLACCPNAPHGLIPPVVHCRGVPVPSVIGTENDPHAPHVVHFTVMWSVLAAS